MERVRSWLKLESGVVLLAAVMVYSALGFNKLWFMLLLLVPDVSMLGYLINQNTGRITYNLGHSYILPAAIGGLGVANGSDLQLQISLIWIAHIGFDRLLGYGLKTGSFKATHLGTIGKK